MLREHIPSHDFSAEQGNSACPQNYEGSFFKKSFYGKKVDKIFWKTSLCVCVSGGGGWGDRGVGGIGIFLGGRLEGAGRENGNLFFMRRFVIKSC